jgi:hypothetical protein
MPTTTVRKPTSIAILCLAALWSACLALPCARAGTVIGHCVSTAQQLQNALSSASTGGQYNGSDNRIKIVQGLYQTRLVTNPSPGTFYYDSRADTGTLSIEGGYNSDCSARSSNPRGTLLDGNFQYQVMSLSSKAAQIKVSGVTIENGESASPGAGLSVSDDATDHSGSLVFNTIIRNNHSTQLGGGLYVGSNGAGNRAIVHNTLIADNSADDGFSAVEIIGNGDGSSFYDNTVYGNSVPGPDDSQRSVYIGGSGGCDVANNIIDHNPNGGLWMSCSPATLYYNDVGNILNDSGATRVGNVSVDPGFVDADGGDFHLASGSPLFGLSHYLVGGSDLEGAPYPTSGHQDIGVYEDTVLVDGFDERVLF